MSGIETVVAGAGAIWLGVLTFAVLLCVSQLTALTHRIELVLGPAGASESGPAIGMPYPDDASELLGRQPEGELVLLMSATCGPCRTVADEFGREGWTGALTVLLPGSTELADEVASLLPPTLILIRDPEASRYAEILGIVHTPFALAVRRNTVVGKSPVNQLGDLRRLEQAMREMDAESLPVAAIGGAL